MAVLPATTLPFTTHEKVLLTDEDHVAGFAVMLPPIFVKEIEGGDTTVTVSATLAGTRKKVGAAKSAKEVRTIKTLRILASPNYSLC
ncbi:unannotated protein [freshwater metagenome]|uniref:Unannotated protein n=1 Tax=freshwater metagenome TaxID=449393 RepID=A0A6J7BDU9_9ZZZZ